MFSPTFKNLKEKEQKEDRNMKNKNKRRQIERLQTKRQDVLWTLTLIFSFNKNAQKSHRPWITLAVLRWTSVYVYERGPFSKKRQWQARSTPLRVQTQRSLCTSPSWKLMALLSTSTRLGSTSITPIQSTKTLQTYTTTRSKTCFPRYSKRVWWLCLHTGRLDLGKHSLLLQRHSVQSGTCSKLLQQEHYSTWAFLKFMVGKWVIYSMVKRNCKYKRMATLKFKYRGWLSARLVARKRWTGL